MPHLVVVTGADVGVEHPLGDLALVGRDPRCQVSLNSPEVSGYHARLLRVGDGYLIEDLQSRNHTYVNDAEITRHRLEDGDRIRVGRTIFLYVATDKGSTLRANRPATMTTELIPAVDLLSVDPASPGRAERLSRRLRLMIDLIECLGEIRGVKTTADRVCALLLEVFPQAASATLLFNQGGYLAPMSTLWRDHVVREHGYSQTIANKAVAEGRAFLTVDALSDDRFNTSRSVVDLNLRSVMCAPVLFKGEALGAIQVDTVSSPRMFTEEELTLFAAVALQVAVAIGNARLYDELQALVLSNVSALTAAMDARGGSNAGHGHSAAQIALALGRRLELTGEQLEDLRLACLLHDVGALSIPEAILSKAGPLDEGEWDTVRAHPVRSVEILEPIRQFQRILPVVRAHHERWDGQGYPDGLAGESIPLLARVLSVADAFSALTAPRPWRAQLDHGAALAEVQQLAGTRFDPQVVAPLERLVRSWQRSQARRAVGGDEPDAGGSAS